MRMLFGLGSLLVVIGLIAWYMGKAELPAVETGQKIKPEVEQIAGRDENGQDASQSATFSEESNGAKLADLKVETVSPGGAYEKYFGLKVGDQIVTVVQNGVDQNASDTDGKSMEAFIQTAYQSAGTLKIRRPGQGAMTLPVGGSKGLPGLGGMNIPSH